MRKLQLCLKRIDFEHEIRMKTGEGVLERLLMDSLGPRHGWKWTKEGSGRQNPVAIRTLWPCSFMYATSLETLLISRHSPQAVP